MLLLIAIIIAFVMYQVLKKQKKQAGIKGWVIDHDLDNKGKHIYRNHKTGISGKPDVVEHNRIVEHKSAVVTDKARYSDILQLAAQLIATGKQKAELAYAGGKKFSFEAGSKVMKKAMKRVDAISRRMRWHLMTRIPPSGTPTAKKCRACMYKAECPESWS